MLSYLKNEPLFLFAMPLCPKPRLYLTFEAPWKLVEKTAFREGGVLEIRRNHYMVNRWNKIFVGLRHNYDTYFIGSVLCDELCNEI